MMATPRVCDGTQGSAAPPRFDIPVWVLPVTESLLGRSFASQSFFDQSFLFLDLSVDLCVFVYKMSDVRPFYPWTQFPFRNCGCPALALFARAGTMLTVPWGLSCPAVCIVPTALITCTLSPLVLSTIAFSAHCAQPRHLSLDSGTDARALSFRSRRLCRDAGTHSPTFDGTRSRDSLDRDASAEAAHGPRFVTQAQTEEPAPTQPIWRGAEAQSFLAGAILRLQRVDDEEARGEAQVYASQSSEAGLGRRTGGVAVEQLSFLSFGRSRAGARE